MAPALPGGFLTTGPPEKSLGLIFKCRFYFYFSIVRPTGQKMIAIELKRQFKTEGTHVYFQLIDVVRKKPTQRCKAIIIQLKINERKYKI